MEAAGVCLGLEAQIRIDLDRPILSGCGGYLRDAKRAAKFERQPTFRG